MNRPVPKPAPVTLDNEAIMDYAGLLADDVIACAQDVNGDNQVVPVGEHTVLLRSSYGVAAAGSDEWVDVQVLVSSEASEAGRVVLASMLHEPASVEIVVNGAYKPNELQAARDKLVNAVYACLLRELSAVAENHRADEGADVQEYADEALARAESFKQANRNGAPTRDMVLDHVHSGEGFQRLLDMNVRDRARALKSIYSTLVDAGLV